MTLTAAATAAPTLDDVVRQNAARIERVYNDRTAGDSTFTGLLVYVLSDLERVLERPVMTAGTRQEPAVGSVVLVRAEDFRGVYERLDDGLWHSTTGDTHEWSVLVRAARPGMPVVLHDGARAR